MLGVLAAQAGRTDEALEMIALALTINPGDARALVNYGNVLTLKGRFDEAVASYDLALAIKPDADVFKSRGHALQGAGRLREALAAYRQALALNPSDVEARYKLGVVLGELGQPDRAMACYERVLALQPDHVEALNNRGYHLVAEQAGLCPRHRRSGAGATAGSRPGLWRGRGIAPENVCRRLGRLSERQGRAGGRRARRPAGSPAVHVPGAVG